jgi:hypothetical protein
MGSSGVEAGGDKNRDGNGSGMIVEVIAIAVSTNA